MIRNLRGLGMVLGLMGLVGLSAGVAVAEITPEAQVAQMKRGVNIIGYDPLWRHPAEARFQTRHMQVIKNGGFDTVRINLHAFQHMDANNQLSPQFFSTLDTMVQAALKADLTVVLDMHNFMECADSVPECRVRLNAFWAQVGEAYKDAPDAVVFELLNEPNGPMDAVWNEVLKETLAVIRKTNPTRNVLIGPAFWNNFTYLEQLELPANDRHIILSLHYYHPHEFTHQGALWSPGYAHLKGIRWGTKADHEELNANFDKAQAWTETHRRPVFLGEFGAYDTADLEDRVAYTAAVARAAEARGWAWAYWQFDSNFIVYDLSKDEWYRPIYEALIPEGDRP